MPINLTTNPGFSKTKKLAIVIVNWNARELLAACLRSLEQDKVQKYANVIVLDSASSDTSVAMVASQFPWVRLIASKENLGFSRGNNAAIKQTVEDFVLLLNPDTEVDPGTIPAMLHYMEQHPNVGIIGPAQRGADGEPQFEAAVAYPTVWNVFCDLAFLSKVFSKSKLFASRTMGYWAHDDNREVPAVPGSALLIRRSVLQEIGLLDETMFCCEDVDICLRTTQAGSKVFFLGTHSLIHHGGGSTKRSKSQGLQRQIAFQSFWLFLRKHQGSFAAARLSLMVGLWSVFGSCLAFLMKATAGKNTERLDSAERYGELVQSLRNWSRMNKLGFHHHLASPPDTPNSTPGLEEAA